MAKGGKRGQKPGKGGGGKKPTKLEDDAALWTAFVRNIDPVELKGRVPDTDSALFDEMLKREGGKAERIAASETRLPPAETAKAKPVVPKPARKTVPTPSELDSREVRRIRSGRSGIDARLDLHGMRQHEAYGALRVFLFRSVAKGHRMVLVITGKGSGHRMPDGEAQFGAFVSEGALGRGVLRRSVPLWLGEPDLRAIVVGYTSAHISHGGEGALYVQLRRKRK